jgi:lipopolysaccharide/colanic/teichoic acid biosynthesis glycosyltransferase
VSIAGLDRDLWTDTSAFADVATTFTVVPGDGPTQGGLVDAIHRLLALVALLVLLPLFVAIAIAVRVDSPGPILFRQVRVGRNGREFVIFKFRTMREDAEDVLRTILHLNEHDGVLFKIRNDPRVSDVGRWLRRFSLDELPQLWNVVRGEMALVGPRPPLPREVAEYDRRTRRRLDVKPGLTGIWQVSGRSDLPWEEAIRLDLDYVERRSVALDLTILARTVGAVLSGRGAY